MNRFFTPAEQVVSNDWYQRPLKMQAAALEKAQAEQNKLIAGLNALTDLQIQHLPQDEQNVINYLNSIDEKVKSISGDVVGETDLRAKAGEIEALSRQVAKDFRQEGYAGSIEDNYKTYSDWSTKVDDMDVVSDKKEAAKRFVYGNYSGVGDYNGYGKSYNRISTFNVADDADLGTILQNKLPKIKGDKYEGFSVGADGSLKPQTWYNGGNGHWYKNESMTEEVTYEEAFLTSLNTLIADNKAKDDYNQRAMLGLERSGHIYSINDIYLKDDNGKFITDDKGKKVIDYSHPYTKAAHNQAIELSYKNVSFDQKMKDDFVWQYKFKKQQDLLYEQNSMATMGRGRVHLADAENYLEGARENLKTKSNRLSQIEAALETLKNKKDGELDDGDRAQMKQLQDERGQIKSAMNVERQNIYGFLKAGAAADGTEDELQMYLDQMVEEKFSSQYLQGTGKSWSEIESKASELKAGNNSLSESEAIKRAFVIETGGKRLPNNFNADTYRDNYYNSAEFLESISTSTTQNAMRTNPQFDPNEPEHYKRNPRYLFLTPAETYFFKTAQKGIDSQDGLHKDVEIIHFQGDAGTLFNTEVKAQLSKGSYETVDGKTGDHESMKEWQNGQFIDAGYSTNPATGEEMIAVKKKVGEEFITKFVKPSSLTLEKTLSDIPKMLKNSATVQRASGLNGVAANSEAIANIMYANQMRPSLLGGASYSGERVALNKNPNTMFDPNMTFSGQLNSRNNLSFHSSEKPHTIFLPQGYAVQREPVRGQPNASQWQLMQVEWNALSSSYELEIARDAENRPLMQSAFGVQKMVTTNSEMLQQIGNMFGPQRNIAPKSYFNIPKK